MPPKPRITKEMILNTVLELTRKNGFETVNARSIADKLECSTRPIFTCYANMEEMKREFLDFAFAFYTNYVAEYSASQHKSICLALPLSYVAFAKEETHLFRLLFVNDMDLHMTEAKDFYQEIGNEEKARLFAEAIGVELERAREIFLDLFLHAHGLAVLTAAHKIDLDQNSVEKRVLCVLTALVRQEKPDWEPADLQD